MERSSDRRAVWNLVIACLAAAAIVLIVHRVDAASAQHEAEAGHAELVRQQDLARQERIPLTVAEFEPKRTPDSEDAAPLYHKAAELIRAADKKAGLWSKFEAPHLDKPGAIKNARAFLVEAKPGLNVAARATKLQCCDLHIRYEVGETAFLAFSELKYLAKVSTTLAMLESHDGKPVAGLNTIAIYAPLCGHTNQTHTLIAALVHAAIDSMYMSAIRNVLAHHGFEPGVAAGASKALKALGPMPDLVLIAEGENLVILDSLSPQYIKSATKDSKPQAVDKDASPEEREQVEAMNRINDLSKRPGMADRWRAHEIDATRRFVSLLGAPEGSWLHLETELDSLGAELARPKDDVHAWRTAMGGGPPWAGVLDSMAVEVSRRRVLYQAAAAFATRAKSGRFPAALPLGGEVARDPLSKAPLHYKLTPNGFTIYGVGPHGVDHGGRVRPPNSSTADYDIVFTYPPPPKVQAQPTRTPAPQPAALPTP